MSFPKKWAFIGVSGSIIGLAIAIVLAIYLVPPTQKIIEKVLPNTQFFQEEPKE